MDLPAAFDLSSFALGFIVGPVAYFTFGAVVYGFFRAAKWIVAPFRQVRFGSQPLRP
jgi:hypothetical protein